ncbi:MAG: SDR family oxidoreductase [Bacteroidetes bacterium]|nr:SDR family oxidoreductase [Bacteroidota bacterium]
MAISDKTIFITGGSTGIGLSIATELAKTGNTLCLFARSAVNLEKAKAQVTSAGAKCSVYPVDAKDYDATKAAIDKAVQENGAPDLLINCVGRAYPDHFENITAAMMEDTMRTNFSSVWNAVHAALPHMKAKGGKIVNTSSIGGFVGVFGYADYSASKFAIVGFSEVLKQELAKYNIEVQVLCPPDTDTPGFAEENKTKPEETKEISKTAKLMTSEALAKETVKALEGSTFMIIPGGDGKLTYWMKRHFPFIVNMVMDSAIKKVRRKA